MKTTSVLVLLLLGLPPLAWADVTPMDDQQLHHALKDSPPCCVIDGRTAGNRKKHPLGDALPYKEGMRINPTAAVVVLADNDTAAQKIASTLDAAYPGKRILAVKGGVDAWEATLAQLSRDAASGPPGGISFVIPKNTCESGSPLQQLRSKSR